MLSNAVSSGTGGAVSITGGGRRRRRPAWRRADVVGGAVFRRPVAPVVPGTVSMVPRTRAVR